MEPLLRLAVARAQPQPQWRSVAVFASVLPGLVPAYERAACELGELLAERPVQLLVEGAGSSGILGAFLSPVLAAGLPVVQVVAGSGGREASPASQRWWVRDRAAGRQRMMAAADALLFLPGGPESHAALWEALLAFQSQSYAPLLVLCNTAQFFQPFLALLIHLESSGFLSAAARQQVRWSETPQALLTSLWPALLRTGRP